MQSGENQITIQTDPDPPQVDDHTESVLQKLSPNNLVAVPAQTVDTDGWGGEHELLMQLREKLKMAHERTFNCILPNLQNLERYNMLADDILNGIEPYKFVESQDDNKHF